MQFSVVTELQSNNSSMIISVELNLLCDMRSYRRQRLKRGTVSNKSVIQLRLKAAWLEKTGR